MEIGETSFLTAEIAILNKSAVALAADSAVTISVGSDQQKIFDSADKLFELTRGNAIGIMINSDMNFMEAPLPVLIKRYREQAPKFARVDEAAKHFFDYLDQFGKTSPARIKIDAIHRSVVPIFTAIAERARERFLELLFDSERSGVREEYDAQPEKVSALAHEMITEEIDRLSRIADSLDEASFVGGNDFALTDAERGAIEAASNEHLSMANLEQRERAVELASRALRKFGTTPNATGVVVAGFGTDELFPTLVSFQIFGMVGDRLKFVQTNTVDVDREGVGAAVLPFAQREMVERFLYGLDGELTRKITGFCEQSVPLISEELIGSLDLSEEEAATLRAKATEAEQAFFTGLNNDAFDAIQEQSRSEIEEMVEFMPKPELARMAEALVNLTSIKRRVSRGFETVGGPIDVAIISKAEGFVWVKRKHYFPEALNARYFGRIRVSEQAGRADDAEG
ncbi:hypothetical protein DBR17_00385 [Sphingomonas sp. HMWF008]|nr:hypothetical protein DBR17_00385 [Sphingomonas sp. HMWF008]